MQHDRPAQSPHRATPEMAMTLEFVTYNGNMDMFTHARVKFELQPTGFLDTTLRLGREADMRWGDSMSASMHVLGNFGRIPYYLIGCLEHFLFFHILGIIIPTDFHIFQRGSYTTNQLHVWLTHSCTSSFSIVASILQQLRKPRKVTAAQHRSCGFSTVPDLSSGAGGLMARSKNSHVGLGQMFYPVYPFN